MRNKEHVEGAIGAEDSLGEDKRDLFELANLFPDETGLPMTVWGSPRDNAPHDVRVKVHKAHGNQMNITNTANVGVRPTPRVISDRLSPADEWAVFAWARWPAH